jgi:hypothetical protein
LWLEVAICLSSHYIDFQEVTAASYRTRRHTMNQPESTSNTLDNMGAYVMPKATETTNVIDAALESGALFEVKSEPMSVAGTVPTIKEGVYKGQPLQKIIYRDTPEGPKVLNVVHPSFPESNYLQVAEIAEALFPESCQSMALIEEGERFSFTQAIGEEVDLGGGDIIQPHLLWTASLNSTWSTGAHGLGHRFFCTNQLPLAKAHIKVRRTLNHDFTLTTRSAIIAQVTDRLAVFGQMVSTLKGIRLSADQVNKLVSDLIPEPIEGAHGKTINTYQTKVAAVRYYLGEEDSGPAAGTAWGFWYAVQSAESHKLTEGKVQSRRQVDMIVNEAQPLTSAAETRLLALV